MRPTMRRLLHAAAICSALALEAPGRVTLVSGKARLFKNGNPLVFSGAVKRTDPKGLQAGDVVDVVDGADKLLGWGVYNPHSMYRVRLLASDEPTDALLTFLGKKASVITTALRVAARGGLASARLVRAARRRGRQASSPRGSPTRTEWTRSLACCSTQ